jgi:hypothetical protein
MSVSLTGDVGQGVGGLGKLIFYGTLAYIAYSIYKGSSLSYFGTSSAGLNSSNSLEWKPISDQEFYDIRNLIR